MTQPPKIAAHFSGVDVPDSPFLNAKRIERINAGKYEGQEIHGALHLVRPGDHVLELGAGLGIVGSVVAKTCKPAKMVAYEANPALIDTINETYKINRLKSRIQVKNEVLLSQPDRPATLPFAVHNSYLGSSLLGDNDRAKQVVDVPTASFNDVVKGLKPHVILMDIEGGELEVLKYADFGAMPQLRGIVIEFHPDQYQVVGMRQCKNILRDAGFERIDDLSTRTVWVAQRKTGQV
jgi:FkbM family methyltransferase